MSNREDRYHTTSWDVRQVQRQQAPSGGPASRSQQPSRPASGGQQGSKKKKAKKRRGMNPILGILLWVVIVVSSSAIFAGVGWMLANDFCAFNKAPLETTVEIPEELEAPVAEGAVVGTVRYTLDGKLLAEVEVLAGHAVPRMSFGTALRMLWQALTAGHASTD